MVKVEARDMLCFDDFNEDDPTNGVVPRRTSSSHHSKVGKKSSVNVNKNCPPFRGGKQAANGKARTFPNPFLNFLADFRRSDDGSNLKQVEVVRKGAAMWRNMTSNEKNPYCEMAKTAPRYRKNGKKRGSYRRRRRRRSDRDDDPCSSD